MWPAGCSGHSGRVAFCIPNAVQRRKDGTVANFLQMEGLNWLDFWPRTADGANTQWNSANRVCLTCSLDSATGKSSGLMKQTVILSVS